MDRSPWIRLADATDPARVGGKASTLARLSGGGFPVVDGWVLPVDAPLSTDGLLAEPVDRWILRSSSPAEDRPGQSAAGWFLSTSVNASPDELIRGMERVRASGCDPRLVEVLGSVAPVAILAQPHLRFEAWLTAEVRAGQVHYDVGWAGPDFVPDLDDLVRDASRFCGLDAALLEIGIAAGRAWILQVRPAPLRAPRPADRPARIETLEPPGGFVPDLEHCPTPMSILLATIFERWLDEDPGRSPSRVVQGRWYDPPGAVTGSTDPRADWDRWRRQLAERVEPALRRLERAHDAIDGAATSWRAFVDDWLRLQEFYFAMPTSGARRWARRTLASTSSRIGLTSTPAAERLRRWATLRERVLEVLDRPSAESIARWVQANAEHPLALDLAECARHDRAVAPLPYDGMTPGLDEDPWPLYRALAAPIMVPAPGRPATGDEELARAILALAETDNELLLESYALWRSAVRRVARIRAVDRPRDLHYLEIGAFEEWLASSGPAPSAAAGRARHAAWILAGSGSGGAATTLEGRAAAGGQARGPVHCAASLLEIEGGGIAVVDTLGPADSIAVPRFDAIVCAGGDLLGHASVLCREFGVPCVVGVAGARQRLARATEILVDGDRGLVHDLSGGHANA